LKITILSAFCVLCWGCTEKPQPQPQAEQQSEQQERTVVICDKQFTITTPDEQRQLGRLAIKAVSQEFGKQIEVVEEVSMDYRRRIARYKSTVVYTTVPELAPLWARVETKVDNATCMTGDVAFTAESFNISGKGFLNKRSLEPIDPPETFEDTDMPLPDGVLIFQSVFPVIGPRFLPEQGQLDNVTFVEFPDDIVAPELVNLKQNYRLTRDAPDQQGNYLMKIFAPNSDQPVYAARFDKNNKVTEMPAFGRAKLIEPKSKQP
jgi:hypothetical protein